MKPGEGERGWSEADSPRRLTATKDSEATGLSSPVWPAELREETPPVPQPPSLGVAAYQSNDSKVIQRLRRKREGKFSEEAV